MRSLATGLIVICSSGIAAAAGGLSCNASDDDVAIALSGGVTHGMGSGLFSFSGKIELRSGEVADDLRVTEFAREHVPQYWLDGDTMKLRLYREREDDGVHGYVEAIVETETGDDGDDHGDYLVAVYDMTNADDGAVEPVQFTGKVVCSVE